MEQESTQSECPLLKMLGEDVTVAGDIIEYVVTRRQKKIDTLISQIDNGLDIDPEISGTVMELLDMHNVLARNELETIDWEIYLSIQNGADYLTKEQQLIKLQENHTWRHYDIWREIRKIETDSIIAFLRLPEPDEYKKARQAYRLVLENIIKRTQEGDLIPDDE